MSGLYWGNTWIWALKFWVKKAVRDSSDLILGICYRPPSSGEDLKTILEQITWRSSPLLHCLPSWLWMRERLPLPCCLQPWSRCQRQHSSNGVLFLHDARESVKCLHCLSKPDPGLWWDMPESPCHLLPLWEAGRELTETPTTFSNLAHTQKGSRGSLLTPCQLLQVEVAGRESLEHLHCLSKSEPGSEGPGGSLSTPCSLPPNNPTRIPNAPKSTLSN